MPGPLGQLLKVEKLRSTVSFAEGVNIVHVAHDTARRRDELRLAQATQKGGLHKPLMNVPHAGDDEAAELELMSVLGDFHGTKLPGPIVNILEQVPMDGAKMRQAEPAGRDAFGGALGDKPPLHAVEFRCVGQAQLVPQDGRIRIGVGVSLTHATGAAVPVRM